MSTYGIPYMGSKDKIAASICINFPKADNFYDLFGGGFSISDYMIRNKIDRYKTFNYNEIKADVVQLIKESISGKYSYDVFKPEWISKKDFFKLKDNNAYVKCIWSFGNNQICYMFGNIENYKRSMHQAVVFDEFDDLASKVFGFYKWPDKVKSTYQKRIYLSRTIGKYRVTKIPDFLHPFLNDRQLDKLGQLQQLEQLQRLERLQRLQRLQQLQRLSFYSKDYREIEILPSSVVYCDPPYIGRIDYQNNFNHKEFYDWCLTRKFPVYISEYTMPKEFKLIYSVDKRSMFSINKLGGNKSENLYWNGVSL